jgi:hypothetical protein
MRNFTLRHFLVPACGVFLAFQLGADCPGPGGGGEICGDGIDNDNDGAIDEGLDEDGDDYLTCDSETLIDCDDQNAAVHPEQPDACDGLDTNCNGIIDDVDADGDGWIDANCGGDDCDDANPNANPDTAESCDGADNNCNGEIDEGFDADDDGWSFCGPDGVAGNSDDDCNDRDPEIHPGATEECDAIDNDCDGSVDEDFDRDGDGYIDRTLAECSDLYGIGAPNADQGDCDDTNADHRPGAQEDPKDGVDNDCDGCTDECEDFDGDGYDNCDEEDPGDLTCAWDNGNDGLAADCLDVDFAYHPLPPVFSILTTLVNPGYTTAVQCQNPNAPPPTITIMWPELFDSVDNNCDGRIDEGYDTGGNPVGICPE